MNSELPAAPADDTHTKLLLPRCQRLRKTPLSRAEPADPRLGDELSRPQHLRLDVRSYIDLV